MHCECFQALIGLRKNDSIPITKLEKGSGVVILNKLDCMDKINQILNDESKFQCLGPTELNDSTVRIGAKLQKLLLKLGKLPKAVYEAVHPTGLQRPQMYGLPKTHIINVSL